VSVEQILLIAPGLMTEVLLGVDFCVANNVKISFPDKCLTMNIGNQVIRSIFHQETDIVADTGVRFTTERPNSCDVRLTSVNLHSSVEPRIN
jgi:hypothetical protein